MRTTYLGCLKGVFYCLWFELRTA